MSFLRVGFVGLIFVVLGAAPKEGQGAEIRNLYYGYQDALKGADNIQAVDQDLFGEQVNLYDGTTSFRSVDISVPTKSALRVELARKLDISALSSDAFGTGGNMREEAKHILGSAWEPIARAGY